MVNYERVKLMVGKVAKVDYGVESDLLASARVIDRIFTYTGETGKAVRQSIVDVFNTSLFRISGSPEIVERATMTALEDSGFSLNPSVKILLDFGSSENPSTLQEVARQLIEQARRWKHPITTGLIRAVYQHKGIYSDLLKIESKLTESLEQLCTLPTRR